MPVTNELQKAGGRQQSSKAARSKAKKESDGACKGAIAWTCNRSGHLLHAEEGSLVD
jgi:hypothetical protein